MTIFFNKILGILVCVIFLLSCTSGKKIEHSAQEESPIPTFLPDAPQSIGDSIRKEFPGATAVHVIADSLLNLISRKYGITPDQMLLGASTCVDDIIYTKNFHTHTEIKGPFHLGGLGGLPFTGVSGLSAFAHHIPDHGTMVLMIAPHIGYTKDKGWGYVLRPGQHEASTCCGALMGTLQKLESGVLKTIEPTDEDYQGIKINNMAVQFEKEIASHHNPLVTLTKLTYKEAEKQIVRQVESMETGHIKYMIIIAGVLINTDYEYTDYLWLNHFSVYDVEKKTFLVDKEVE